MDFGMRPLPGVRITVISRDVNAPYSGMLPGLIAGHYTFEEAHLDVRKLAGFAGAQFYHASVTGIDLENKLIHCEGRPAVRFDVLSINTGSTPEMAGVPGAREYAIPVKPVDRFLERWSEMGESDRAPLRIVTVGGGAGGVELSLATQFALRERGVDSEFTLVSDADSILPTHNGSVQRRYARVLQNRGVRVHLGQRVVEVREGEVSLRDGMVVPYDVLFWTTSAAAPKWPKAAGLATDERGFIAVNDCLQSQSHPFVFAAGDVAAMTNHPRPKAGVFAVRQGMPLARNLRLVCAGKPPIPFKPQRSFLSLISTGDQYAVASKGPFAVEGGWVWRWKNWIDVRWMKKYQELPEMRPRAAAFGREEAGATGDLREPFMPCSGCGSKVGSTILSRVLARLNPVERGDVLIGLDAPDDAAVIEVPTGKVAVQTIDSFRSFLNDPHTFGKIAANHALSDIFAMGAVPQAALAVAVVPYGNEAAVEEQLFQVLSGAAEILNECGCALAGGHSSEGAELSFGLSVQGLGERERLLRKGGAKPGDCLILTKRLGTGTLLAADMRRKARGVWVEAAVESMLQSNSKAAGILRAHGATACTDVTGFGLLGHLVEMLKAGGVSAEIELNALPLIDGAADTIRAGILSSLHPDNLRLGRAISNREETSRRELHPILFDPQTSGGLLAAVPETEAEACVRDLREAGVRAACRIGRVLPVDRSESEVSVR